MKVKVKHSCKKAGSNEEEENEAESNKNQEEEKTVDNTNKLLILSSKAVSKREESLSKFMMNCPNLTLREYYMHDINQYKDNKIFSWSKIERMLNEVKSVLYPKQPEITFSSKFNSLKKSFKMFYKR